MAHTIDCCKPDCLKRVIGCHAICKEYKDARAIFEQEKAQFAYTKADEYMFDQLKAKKVSVEKSQRKNKPYKGRVCNFK